MATCLDSGPGAMLMAGEPRGCFLKSKGEGTLDSARKSFLFSYMLLINSSKQKSSCRTRFWSLWKHRRAPSGRWSWTLNLRSYSMNAVRKKNGEKTRFSQSWMTKDSEWFIQFCEMITELLGCSGLPRRPEVSVNHSFSLSSVPLESGAHLCDFFFSFLF